MSSASTVAEGLALLDPPPDYLILDLGLPDAGGEVILRRVRDAGLRTRVAITTGTDDAERLSRVKALKPEVLFEKPVNVADVWRGQDRDFREYSSSPAYQPKTRPGPRDDRPSTNGGLCSRKPPYTFLLSCFTRQEP